jgi:hypothetical protein
MVLFRENHVYIGTTCRDSGSEPAHPSAYDRLRPRRHIPARSVFYVLLSLFCS